MTSVDAWPLCQQRKSLRNSRFHRAHDEKWLASTFLNGIREFTANEYILRHVFFVGNGDSFADNPR